MASGSFVISLDFELHWGVSDHRTIDSYYENLKNTPEVVRRLLQIFEQRKIHATWATVGMLFCHNKQELMAWVKEEDRPSYSNPALSNYTVATQAGENEKDDPFHYANTLVKQILHTKGQELATHTFSHYYCLEPGQNTAQFAHDLKAAVAVAEREGQPPVSIVFPRNQYDNRYIDECVRAGIPVYRGNPNSWIYRSEAKSSESLLKRLFRLADTYLPISSQRHVHAFHTNGAFNIPGTCFLRPYNKKLAMLEGMRIARIKREMTAAAKQGTVYHLWWHPHNFGKYMDENFDTLRQVLDHFDRLSLKYNMQSMNMKEVYEKYK